MARWKFTDVHQTGPSPYTWTFNISPSEGGSPNVEKGYNVTNYVGPRRQSVIQEGQMSNVSLEFSGTILTKSHYETFEIWFRKRVLIELVDDLGRTFRGGFASFRPQRVYKPNNFWYHKYTATFQVIAYRNASGITVYGRF